MSRETTQDEELLIHARLSARNWLRPINQSARAAGAAKKDQDDRSNIIFTSKLINRFNWFNKRVDLWKQSMSMGRFIAARPFARVTVHEHPASRVFPTLFPKESYYFELPLKKFRIEPARHNRSNDEFVYEENLRRNCKMIQFTANNIT